MATFSLIYTSVRSALIKPVIEDWMHKAANPDNLEVVLTVDANDKASQEVAASLEGKIANFRWFIQESAPFNCVKGWNLAAAKSTGKVLVQVTDDMVPPAAWDASLERLSPSDWMERDTAVHVEDGYVHDIMVLAIITRVRYERFGYFFYPDYESLFCLPAETKIYMADHSFKCINEIQIGDTVVGTERRYGKRGAGKHSLEFLCPAEVTAIHTRKARVIKLTLASGKVLRCTSDHRWGYYDCYQKYGYGIPRVGTKLINICAVPELPPSGFERDLGWLAGIFDGEGTFPVISQSLTHNPSVCAEIERVLKRLGIAYSIQKSYDVYHKRTGRVHHQRVFTLTGGRDGYLRFLNWVRPVKFNTVQSRKRMFTARIGTPDEVTKIENGGVEQVYCLTTASHNFVADGFLSHNCDTELTEVAYKEGVVIIAKHLLFEHRHPDCQKRTRDAVDLVHASKERWTRGETLFYHRRAKGFPIDVGSKATEEAKHAVPEPLKFCVYIQATRDDFCLEEVCLRMMEEGVNDFFFSVPDEYWSGRPTPPEHVEQVRVIASRIKQAGARTEVMVHRVKTYRFAGDTRLRVETRVRNDAMAYIRRKGWEHVLIVDGDELWKRGTLDFVRRVLLEWHPSSINCRMTPVIGLPGYPIDGATDVAVIYINSRVPFQECRTPIGDQFRIQMPLVTHFTGTRRTMEEIIQKHKDSGHYDDPDYDFQTWLDKVLPNIKPGFVYDWGNGNIGLHFYKKYQIWPKVRHWMDAELSEMPKSLWRYLGLANAADDRIEYQPGDKVLLPDGSLGIVTGKTARASTGTLCPTESNWTATV